MPELIEHIDAIARRKGRDVLWIFFNAREEDDEERQYPMGDFDYESTPPTSAGDQLAG